MRRARRPSSIAPPRRTARWRSRLRLGLELSVIGAAVALALLWASIPSTDALARGNPTTTAFIELRREQAQAARRPFRLAWRWRRLDQISPLLRAAVVHAEDARFYDHDGVDWTAIEKAAESNLARGGLAVGGSTLTQQLAKNLYLSPSRSMVRKVRELLIAARLEASLDKRRILELYLNVAEWGDGVFGAEAAARHWFGRSANALTATQAARLAAALPNPFIRTPKRRTAQLQRKVARLLASLRRDGLLDERAFLAAVAEAGLPLPGRGKASVPIGATAEPSAAEPATAEPATAEPATAEPASLSERGAPAEEPSPLRPADPVGGPASEPTASETDAPISGPDSN